MRISFSVAALKAVDVAALVGITSALALALPSKYVADRIKQGRELPR